MKTTTKPITAEQIIKDLTFCDEPKHLKKCLHALIIAYLLQPEDEMTEDKDEIYGAYYLLNLMLKKIEKYESVKLTKN